MKPLLTVPIRASSPEAIERQLRQRIPSVQAYEIWLDALPKKFLEPKIIGKLVSQWKKITKKKLIVVCKDKMEQGRFTGTKSQKANLLIAAAQAGVHYVDIGLQTNKKNISTLMRQKGKTKLMVSFHDFKKTPTPPRLLQIIKQMKQTGADIIKVATFVNTLEDTQNLIDLALELKTKKQPHIIVGMGEKGIATRILGQKLGNELQFVTLEAHTAPGPLSLQVSLAFKIVL